jgi:hypothetical protein
MLHYANFYAKLVSMYAVDDGQVLAENASVYASDPPGIQLVYMTMPVELLFPLAALALS